jgi:uncharacterized protein
MDKRRMTSKGQSSNAASPEESIRSSCIPLQDHRIIIMTRCPEAGKAKTRLIPALGPEAASELHTCLVQHTLKTVGQFAERNGCDLEVQYAGGTLEKMQHLFGSSLRYRPQQGELLGDRIVSAVDAAFLEGDRRVVVIGTDCPQLQVEHLEAAFSLLQQTDVSIGPAADGGYYLIGMREPCPALFANISWGSDRVFQETLRNLRRMRKTVTQLPVLSDIDFPEDLVICRSFPEEFCRVIPPPKAGLLSVIIPALNEEQALPGLLSGLLLHPQIEVIVADGGSTDGTCEFVQKAQAQQLNVRLLRCQRGRGRQMNAGAAVARGDVLLFLHADARLPDDFPEAIRRGLTPPCVAGAFSLRIDSPRRRYRLIEFGANKRSQWLKLPYGDQGLFLRAETFYAMNGFQNWPLMEDYEFMQRLRRRGPIFLASSPAIVSARRWEKLGVLKTTLINQFIIAAYHLGVPPQKLATVYSGLKRGVRPE